MKKILNYIVALLLVAAFSVFQVSAEETTENNLQTVFSTSEIDPPVDEEELPPVEEEPPPTDEEVPPVEEEEVPPVEEEVPPIDEEEVPSTEEEQPPVEEEAPPVEEEAPVTPGGEESMEEEQEYGNGYENESSYTDSDDYSYSQADNRPTLANTGESNLALYFGSFWLVLSSAMTALALLSKKKTNNEVK